MHDRSDLIGPHGGYRKLKSFQGAEIVYDATVKFCDRFVDGRSRTMDQMVQLMALPASLLAIKPMVIFYW